MKKQVKKTTKTASRQQLVRIAKVVNHKDYRIDYESECGKRIKLPIYTYALMLLKPHSPDNNHIYYEWVTEHTGSLTWARAMSKQYGIEIEDLTK